MQKRGEEGQGTAEACVIVLPQSFDPGCCSCCYLEHLCLIRGKWVVRKKKTFTLISFSPIFSFFMFCILMHSLGLSLVFLIFISACVIILHLFLSLNEPHAILFLVLGILLQYINSMKFGSITHLRFPLQDQSLCFFLLSSNACRLRNYIKGRN